MSEATVLKTLDEKVNRLQLLEMTEESATLLHTPSPTIAAAQKSQYKQKKDPRERDESKKEGTGKGCRWCGRTRHPGGKPLDRFSCPAYNKECLSCHKMGHFAKVCEQAKVETTREYPLEEPGEEALQQLPSEASVSFAFGAQGSDFRRVQQPNGDK